MFALAAPAGAWVETAAYDVPGDGVADCLRATGSGRVAVLEGLASPTLATRLLDVRAGSIARAQATTLGELVGCPATADGSSPLFASTVRMGRTGARAQALRVTGGRRPQLLRVVTRWAILNVVTAQAPGGAAVVAWTEATRRFHQTRVLASVRPPGDAPFAAPVVLARSPLANARPAAGIDSSGRATVAWADSSGDRAFDAIRMAASSPTGRFGMPRRIAGATWRGFDDARVALAVTPDGPLLLAAETLHGLRAWARASATGHLALVPVPRARKGDVRDLDVALNADGGAVIAYDEDRGPVLVARRRPGGAFAPWEAVVPVGRSHGRLGLFWGLSFASRSSSRPLDWRGGELRTALAEDGEIVVGWVDPVHGAEGAAALAAHGTLAGGMEPPEQLGSPCRPAAVSTPVRLPGDRLAVAWSDHAHADSFFDSTRPRGGGRVHLALPRTPAGEPLPTPPPSAPRLSAQLADTRPLGAGEPLRVRVHCEGPCDVRAVAISFLRSPAARALVRLPLSTSTTLSAGGDAELRLGPISGLNAAGLRGAPRVPIRLVACIPGGSITDRLELTPPPIAVPPPGAPEA